ncbi:hypothetical protein DFH09DRAFT_1329064 [Mycena vulgaris]|nr:hypothetical protein DFH09DRAFT_1329064 [Mycena vulgaris]
MSTRTDFVLDPRFYEEDSSDIDFESHFPELDPGYYDEESGTWRKPTSPQEEATYKAITPHPRILAYHGFADYDGEYIELQYHPKGDLWTYFLEK